MQLINLNTVKHVPAAEVVITPDRFICHQLTVLIRNVCAEKSDGTFALQGTAQSALVPVSPDCVCTECRLDSIPFENTLLIPEGNLIQF